MKKKYEFIKSSVTTVEVDNDCDCSIDEPCLTCNNKAWEDFENGDGVTVVKPIIWGVE